jgi:hypothetical protein
VVRTPYSDGLRRGQAERRRWEPLSPTCAAALRILYEWIHLHLTDGRCAQKELTFGVNLNLESLQEAFRLNAHEVGRALTSLGFTNRKRSNEGCILWLDLRTRKRIHNLAHDYAIDQESRSQQACFGNGCELCKSLPSLTLSDVNEYVSTKLCRARRRLDFVL